MFNSTDRLPIVQEMILAETQEDRQAALDRLLPIQRADFKGIFKAMKGLPVTVRLLDPPMHEFLPTAAQLELEIAHLHQLRDSIGALKDLPDTLKLLNPKLYQQYADGLTKLVGGLHTFEESHLEEDVIKRKETILKKVRSLEEVNPMLGHRGVRLGISYPEIYSMQIQAILEAAALCAKEGVEIYPEIMVPQVATVEELKRIHSYVQRLHKVVELTHGIDVKFKFGTMLEVVRACLRAGRMAQDAEFFSFGTNDLTQATFSFSREDAENKFLPAYTETGILQDNPFEVLDIKGVGQLMKMAVEDGRNTRPDLKVGICGEHGGDPVSIHFCHQIGINYVSCSGPRVPVARLAAAQAKLLEQQTVTRARSHSYLYPRLVLKANPDLQRVHEQPGAQLRLEPRALGRHCVGNGDELIDARREEAPATSAPDLVLQLPRLRNAADEVHVLHVRMSAMPNSCVEGAFLECS